MKSKEIIEILKLQDHYDVLYDLVQGNDYSLRQTLGNKIGEFEISSFNEKFVGDSYEMNYDYRTVIYFKDHDVYICVEGNYRSFQGTEVDNIYEVEPKKVVVTEFTKKENIIKTFADIQAALDKADVSKDEFADGDFEEDIAGPFKRVFRQGGEGKGEDWSVVYHFTDHDVYIRLDGYYTSYTGVDFSDYEMYEVKPNERTVTFYE